MTLPRGHCWHWVKIEFLRVWFMDFDESRMNLRGATRAYCCTSYNVDLPLSLSGKKCFTFGCWYFFLWKVKVACQYCRWNISRGQQRVEGVACSWAVNTTFNIEGGKESFISFVFHVLLYFPYSYLKEELDDFFLVIISICFSHPLLSSCILLLIDVLFHCMKLISFED